MTRDETMDLITKIRAYFPSWNPKVSPRELLETWFEGLRKYEIAAIEDMLEKYIQDDESGYAPAISQLIPKQNKNGFMGRIYSHADFVEMEKAALKETMGGLI